MARLEGDPPIFTPPGGGKDDEDDDKRKPLGVDEDYRVPAPIDKRDHLTARAAPSWAASGYVARSQGPRYWDGDEMRPASLDPASIVELQRNLMLAGLLTDFRWGIWDDKTRSAYKSLLEESNMSGLTWEQQLARRQQSVDIGSGGGEGGSGGFSIDPETGMPVQPTFTPPPLQVRTTNPDDLKRVFRTAVIDKLGVGWNQAKIDELVNAYNWKEIQVQKDAYDQEVARMEDEFYGRAPSTEPITMVDAPSPETFLEDRMIEEDPVGFQAGQATEEFIPALMSMVEGWV